MKQYKHKLTNHLAEQDNRRPEIYNVSGLNTNTILPKERIENSNDWEEIIEKPKFEVSKWYSVTSIGYGKQKYHNLRFKVKSVLKEYISYEYGYYINSSNEYTIGSIIKLDKLSNIKELPVGSKEIQQYLPNNHPDKIKPKVLFTTYDGVELYEKCELYNCFKTGFREISNTIDVPSITNHLQCNSINLNKFNYFSTEEACQAYLDNIHKPKQDYKILSIKWSNYIYTWNDDINNFYYKDGIISLERVKEGYLGSKDGKIEINSIKRLSDGEIFTIGDAVNIYGQHGILTGFSLGMYNDKLFRIVIDHNDYYLLSNVTKVKYTPSKHKYKVEARNNDEKITVKLTKEKYDLLMELLEE